MRHCNDCGALDDCRELVIEDELTGEVLARDYWLCADCWGDL